MGPITIGINSTVVPLAGNMIKQDPILRGKIEACFDLCSSRVCRLLTEPDTSVVCLVPQEDIVTSASDQVISDEIRRWLSLQMQVRSARRVLQGPVLPRVQCGSHRRATVTLTKNTA